MKFITLSNQRSGSSPFQRLLNSHPYISARQEDLRNYRKQGRKLKDVLNNIFRRDRGKGAIGFKVQYDHIHSGFWKYMENHNVKVIQLIRKDLLETVLWFKKNHIGDTEGGLGPPLIVRGKVEAKIDKILTHMVWLRDQIEKNRARADFTVYYEQFTNNEDTRFFRDVRLKERLLKFLDVANVEIAVPEETNVKNTRGKSEDIVTNWKELISEMEKKGIERYYNE